MQCYEVNDVFECLPYIDRPNWEQCRLNSYVIAQVNSRKQIKPTDIMNFAWDKDNTLEDEHNYEISNTDIKKLKDLAKQWT